jgi:hypothetical protein
MDVFSRRRMLELLGGAAILSGTLDSVLAGQPDKGSGAGLYLTACTRPGGHHGGAILSGDGELIVEFELPGRGHGAALRPGGADAVVFARRPGTFALVLDPASGAARSLITARGDRHFYGHGCFSVDGGILYAAENDFDGERGAIGLYDAKDGYRRIGEFTSHGIGPHEITLMADQRTLLVANGGILTHPDSDRIKLNPADMEPSVVLMDAADGTLIAKYEPPKELRQLSLRHIDASPDGHVVAVAQWEGAMLEQPPLVAVVDHGRGLTFNAAPSRIVPRMRNYCGSVTYSNDGKSFAVSSPRGGVVTFWDCEGNYLSAFELEDTCGVAASGNGFLLTSGLGVVTAAGENSAPLRRHQGVAFDNHLIPIRI